ncbi:YdcF family protein [Stenotrophomonas maltophilia]|uniref:YdcF family protein n=1 Tax=Stenotrophomonas maltophilia TaxID=40324 RepID=UPI00115E8247|nr:YdcF family protein [Stenotrophomonas maltophilia]
MHRRLALSLVLLATAALPLAAVADDRDSATLAARLFPTLMQLKPDTLPDDARALLAERTQQLARCRTATCTLASARWTPAQAGLLTAAAPAHAEAIERELAGLNNILSVYGQGQPSRYDAIDGPVGAAGSTRLVGDVAIAMQMSEVDASAAYTAFDRSIAVAVGLLDANDRLDAIRFEPTSAGTNAAPFARARQLDWNAHPYTAIIVLGQGPDELTTPLSAGSKLRLKAAAQRYAAGDAPFLIVSGGAVHPRGTRSVEAVQMREALMARFGIPADAIIIEPYARHTTTNLRNAARLLAALQAPPRQPALVVSSPSHIDSVASSAFSERNRHELGYVPGKVGSHVSPYAIPFVPAPESLRIDPMDPLDP